MAEASIPALRALPAPRDNPLTRSLAGVVGMAFLAIMVVACIGSLPYTLGRVYEPGAGEASGSPRFDRQYRTARHIPPWWAGVPSERGEDTVAARLDSTASAIAMERLARERSPEVTVEALKASGVEPTAEQLAAAGPRYWLGSDLLGRSLLIRSLTGGGISLTIGIAAAMLSVFLGTLYGAIAGYVGGRTDAIMMRIVDVLYGLPYILLVVLLAVASESVIDEFVSRERARERWIHRTEDILCTSATGSAPIDNRSRELFRQSKPDPRSLAQMELVMQGLKLRAVEKGDGGNEARMVDEAAGAEWIGTKATMHELIDGLGQWFVRPRDLSTGARTALDLTVLFVAIGGVSWLTMARVVRGQVLSLKAQPFMEAARAMGVPVWGQFVRHLLPNLVGPISVYATLTVPQAILQESFLSFLGIGVRPPLPSWGNLAAEGLSELNPYESRWWLLLFPCLLLGLTLLALNFVGEGLREALDPKRARR
jgi:ABC-type dipeptide/oligopeptide/nickel transport system permease subunit